MAEFVLESLGKTFGGDVPVTALEGVNLRVRAGEFVCLLGASGCGKSTLLDILAGLERPSSGTALFDGRPIAGPEPRRGLVFQDPALFPWRTIAQNVGFGPELRGLGRRERRARAVASLARVGLAGFEDAYPHQLSGGMRQRVMIAMALACEPSLLIADEPTTALDVTIQAQILALIAKLRDKLGMGVVLITHDLGVVAEVASHVVVMYAGRVVECAPVTSLFERPRHPYTRGLLRSLPSFEAAPVTKANADGGRKGRARLPVIEGIVPDLMALPPGCRFVDRCPMAIDACRDDEPALATVGGNPKHLSRCIRAEEV